MAGWLANKLRSGRIKMSCSQLFMELETSRDEDVAGILVAAIYFCWSLRDGPNGALLALSVENPSMFPTADASDLYFNLEDLLFEGQRMNAAAVKVAAQRQGAAFAAKFKETLQPNERGIRLLMTRIGMQFDETCSKSGSRIFTRLSAAIPHIDAAVKSFAVMQRIAGPSLSDEAQTELRESAVAYAFSFPSH